MQQLFVFIILFLFASLTAAEEGSALHDAILAAYDAQDYSSAAENLERLKKEYPARYGRFPYSLLQARALWLAGKSSAASELYQTLSSEKRWSRFALLPAARIFAAEGKAETAIRFFQDCLRNKNYPDYLSVAWEALEYCYAENRPDDLAETAQTVRRNSATDRLGQYYLAKSYLLKRQDSLARSLFLSLLRSAKRDEFSARSLSELERIEGSQLSERELMDRGKLAFQVWNFELARKYLEPVATKSMESSYYYARTLSFLGNFDGSKKAFQAAIDLWPEDPLIPLATFQYAAVCHRDGDVARAEELYRKIPPSAPAGLKESAAYKMLQMFQSKNRRKDAMLVVQPYCVSQNRRTRARALFQRGRLYFQQQQYKEALADFDQALKLKSGIQPREVLLWKGIVLEKMNRPDDAHRVFLELGPGYDFFTIKAFERLPPNKPPGPAMDGLRRCRLPDRMQEEKIMRRTEAGDLLPALLYLHLYEEAAQLLPSVSHQTWEILGTDVKNRLQRYLGIAHLALLGNDYPKATYYSEIFLKNFSPRIRLTSLPQDILQILFPIPYKKEIQSFSKLHGVDPFLLTAIMRQESKFKKFARSQSFARGLMQLIPSTATRVAAAAGLSGFALDQLYDPDINIRLGAKYIQEITMEFGKESELIAATYNGGEANVRRWLACSAKGDWLDFFSNIDFAETKNYVALVRFNHEMYKRTYAP